MRRFFTKHFTLFIILLAVCILLIILHQIGFLAPIENIVYKTTTPVHYIFTSASNKISGFFKVIFTARSLQKENKELKKKIDELIAENAQLKEAKVENEILRKQLGFAQQEDFQLLSAEIISFEPSNFLKNFTISKGKNQGIQTGMAVTCSGLLVGKIVKVSDNCSIVSLITDPESRIGGMVQDSRASGIIKGQLGYGLIMESIPQDEVINPGQEVITSGLGGEFPKGIVIGYIEDVSSRPNEIFQSATLRPAVDFRQLEIVFVIVGRR
jgi:rod shape-determining protein MreC